MSRYDLVVIGGSAGGLKALCAVLEPLPAHFPLPILVVLHTAPGPGGVLPGLISRCCKTVN